MENAGHAVLIIGCGDVGRRVALLHRGLGQDVIGVVRSEHSAERLRALGIAPLIADLDTPQSWPAAGSYVYYFAPPPEVGTRDPRIRAFLAACEASGLPQKLVYISTSGVYGDCRGAWVDETTPPNPQTDRGKRRLDAEHALREWHRRAQVPVVILRVGGIYGPGRLPVDRIRARRPVLSERESGYTNRIHVDDLAQVCVAAMRHAPPAVREGIADIAVYNACDGRPGTMTQYFNAVADLCGLPRPPVIDRAEAERRLPASLLSFLNESRRMDNTKMLRELGIELRHPDLASGLAACLGEAGTAALGPPDGDRDTDR